VIRTGSELGTSVAGEINEAKNGEVWSRDALERLVGKRRASIGKKTAEWKRPHDYAGTGNLGGRGSLAVHQM